MIYFNSFLIEETEKLIKFFYREELISIFMNVKVNKQYSFRAEHILQIFLDFHLKCHNCLNLKSFDSSVFLTFEPDSMKIMSNLTENQINMFQSGVCKFSGWLHLMQLFLNAKIIKNSVAFETLCDGISSVIEKILHLEQYFPIERGKPMPKPKFSPPAQTLLVNIDYFYIKMIFYLADI